MNYDLNNDRLDWKDEASWAGIAAGSGLLLALLFAFFERFPGTSLVVVAVWCCLGFYILSVLLRLQNHRGEFWLGRTILNEGRLKVVFPVVGFIFGLALLIF